MKIVKIPFYFEATKKPDNNGFPQVFPIKVNYDKKFGMFFQKPTKTLQKILNNAYLTGTMLSGGMNDACIGKERIDVALNFIKDYGRIKKGTKVLEIGCGEGQILLELSRQGLSCTGLEPGPQIKTLNSNQIRIIQDFFPSKKLKNKYDLLLHFGVIEHIPDPVKFLRDQEEFLTKEGKIICGFPNCEPDLRAGDISLFLHEHFNYFSRDSFTRIAEAANFSVAKIEEGARGGMFHAMLKRKSRNYTKTRIPFFTNPQDFTKKADELRQAIDDFFSNTKEEDIAVYCPLRCMNLLYICGISSCRLVDDNPMLHKKFLPTFKQRIENFHELKLRPPRKILIYSKTFDDVIRRKIRQTKELKHCEIKTISELVF